MKFTTPCFVRVEDAEKRKELAVWLSSIGRYVSPAVTSSDYHKDWVIVTEPYDPDLDGYVGIWAKTPNHQHLLTVAKTSSCSRRWRR